MKYQKVLSSGTGKQRRDKLVEKCVGYVKEDMVVCRKKTTYGYHNKISLEFKFPFNSGQFSILGAIHAKTARPNFPI